MVQRAGYLWRLEQLLALVLLADGGLQIQFTIARVELAVQVCLIEHLQLSGHLVRGDVHLGPAHLLLVALSNVFLQLCVLDLQPVERRHLHVVANGALVHGQIVVFCLTFALLCLSGAMLLDAWKDLVRLVLHLNVALVAQASVIVAAASHVHLALGTMSPVLRGPLL